MKLSEFLVEARPLKARGDINAPAYAKFAGTAPMHRLTKKQQQVRDSQPNNPRQPQQQQQPQQPQQKQQQQAAPQPAEPQMSPEQQQQQQQAQDQAKQLLGGVDITPENVAKVLPNLIKGALNKDQQWARMMISVVANTAGRGMQTKMRTGQVDKVERFVKSAARSKMTKQELSAAASKLNAMAQQTTESIIEAAAAAAPPKNPANPKQIALAQIQAALKKLPDNQLITLKSQIQHMVRGGDDAIGKVSLRGVPQQDIKDANAAQRWKTGFKQEAKNVGQATAQTLKKDFTTMPTFKKWFGKKSP